MSQETTGWAPVPGSRKWHYFNGEKRTLCGKWLLLGGSVFEQGNDNSSDNCATCRRQREKLATSDK